MVGVASRAVLIWRYLASWGMFLDERVTGDGEVVPEDRSALFQAYVSTKYLSRGDDAMPTHVPEKTGFRIWRFYHCAVD